jgi:hypothetical protein
VRIDYQAEREEDGYRSQGQDESALDCATATCLSTLRMWSLGQADEKYTFYDHDGIYTCLC